MSVASSPAPGSTVVEGSLRVLEGVGSVGAMHIFGQKPIYATTQAVEDGYAVFVPSAAIAEVAREFPEFSDKIIESLSEEVVNLSEALRTPLLDQKPKPTPLVATSAAAAVESFFRAAMNTAMNTVLLSQTGTRAAGAATGAGLPSLAQIFPNMHIQLPTRVLYINGFKGIRHLLNDHVDPEDYSHPDHVRLLAAITPGVLMTPVSSVLEACNAGHSNPEPLWSRWRRGLVPRGAREVIFGVGLNQLSDWFEERVPIAEEGSFARGACGSMLAGIVCGYFSHVPHNLSTLKLLQPEVSYQQHLQSLVNKTQIPLWAEALWPSSSRSSLRLAMTFLAPAGLTVRTSQIIGSFVIINGIIGYFDRDR